MSDSDCRETDNEDDAKIEIKTEDLIAEVEKRPVIYNQQLKEYNNRALKQEMWQEVCAALYEKWETFSKADKTAKERYIQKRWKHARDAFTRHHRNSQEQGDRVSRKYIYHDSLLFLLPHFSEKQKNKYGLRGDEQPSVKKLKLSHEKRTEKLRKSSGTVPKVSKQTSQENEKQPTGSKSSMSPLEMLCRRPLPMTVSNHNPYENSLLSMLHDKINEEPDEDKHFAMMLVPMLKKLNEDQKHYAKIEMLKVIRNAKKTCPSSDSLTSDIERINGSLFVNSNAGLSPFKSEPSPIDEPINYIVPDLPSTSESQRKESRPKSKLRIKLKK